jgi:hypothetical protein
VVRLGSAAGVKGPRIYLAKGKELIVASMTKKYFARIHKAPIGSYVKMTPNAYMTNEVWLDIAPSLCKGIRSMKGICDHPNWWVVLSYDGYGSHLQNDALEVFTAEKKTCHEGRGRYISSLTSIQPDGGKEQQEIHMVIA